MVKGVVGEETRLKSVEDRLAESGAQSEVGLVIGKLSSSLDRGFVYDLVPTPANDAGDPACVVVEANRDDKKKGGKAKAAQADSAASFVIDNDWIAEHARQVSRMLLGGMKVVGIYIWISESSFKSAANMLCQTLKGVAAAGPSSEIDSNERLLIHISYSPRRWVCRNCTVTSSITSSSLRPCDFKMGRVMSSLVTYRSTYNFDLRLPICPERSSDLKTMADSLRQGISIVSKELKDAKALVDGILAEEDEPYKSDGVHEIEFLLPFTQAQEQSQKEVAGIVHFNGSVSSYAFLNSKEPLSEVLADIKTDIITSLESRLDIICDEADAYIGSSVEGNELETGKRALSHFLKEFLFRGWEELIYVIIFNHLKRWRL
uniref:Protein odr-4 homolog n=1 Tax=Kalanchoe fedtschenkoi TaxID=63787 RepID=A0A7N1A370_KALFE